MAHRARFLRRLRRPAESRRRDQVLARDPAPQSVAAIDAASQVSCLPHRVLSKPYRLPEVGKVKLEVESVVVQKDQEWGEPVVVETSWSHTRTVDKSQNSIGQRIESRRTTLKTSGRRFCPACWSTQ